MGWEYFQDHPNCTFEKLEHFFLQMVPNCENWWGGLYATTKHSTTKCWTCENLLWIVVQINKLFIS